MESFRVYSSREISVSGEGLRRLVYHPTPSISPISARISVQIGDQDVATCTAERLSTPVNSRYARFSQPFSPEGEH